MNHLPPPENHSVACERVRCLAALFEASVSSGARTESRNSAVGGDENSKHQISFGCNGWDLVADHPRRHPELAASARILGFWEKNEGDHVHLQSLPPGPDSRY